MQLSESDLIRLSEVAMLAAREAGAYIQSRAQEGVAVQHKEGGSNIASQVVTEVDLHADAMIAEILRPTCAEYELAMLTEESTDDRARLEKHAFWSVDPMDGTMAFIKGKPGYAVAIGLVAQDGSPLIGVVFDPVEQMLYSAVRGQGAQRNGKPWQWRAPQAGGPFMLVFDWGFAERAYYPAVAERIGAIAEARGCSSVETLEGFGATMNSMRVLEHAPGCYFKFPKPQLGGGSLWDFAANTAIFQEFGASACDFYGAPLELNRADSTFMNHRGVLYATDEALAREVRRLISIVVEN